MATTSAFICDGPTCSTLTPREPNSRFPAGWLRLTLSENGTKAAGSFHSPECARAWLNEQLGNEVSPRPG